MKRICNALLFPILIGCLLIAVSQNSEAQSPEFGTAISVMGDVSIRDSAQGEWNALKKGSMVKEGSTIKTGQGAFVRLLAPTGKMIKIPGGKESVIHYEQKTAQVQEEGGVSTFVAEFFSPNARTRINAVRSHLHPLQQDWLAFCLFEEMSADKIDIALELSAAFQNERIPNRSVFILWKLHDLFPENQGIKVMADQAVQSYQPVGQWEINDAASSDEPIQIRYRSPDESYAYLFHTRNSDGNFQTQRLFPKTGDIMGLENDTFFASRISGEEIFYAKEDGVSVTKMPEPFSDEIATLKKGQVVDVIQEQGRRYQVRVDDAVTGWVLILKLTSDNPSHGRRAGDILAEIKPDPSANSEYVWGWTSPGPLNERIVEQAVAQAERLLKQQGSLDERLLKDALPGVCKSLTAKAIAQR